MTILIGPICSGYVPFHTALVLPLQLPEIEVALLLPVWYKISVKPILRILFYRVWKEASFSGDRTAVPSGEILRSGRSTTVLASPGHGIIYWNKISVYQKNLFYFTIIFWGEFLKPLSLKFACTQNTPQIKIILGNT